MEYLGRIDSDVRAIVIAGSGKVFSAGLDMNSAMGMQELKDSAEDPARSAIKFFDVLRPLQEGISSLEKVRVPVIAAIHGYCIGAGVDVVSACDIRYAAKGTKFTIKEIDLGLASDVGVLQRFPKTVGNDSWARELAFTARYFDEKEALKNGFISKVSDTPEQCLADAIALAKLIASKSPVAVTTTKQSLIYSRDHNVQAGLDHICWLNSAMLQTNDTQNAAMASF